MVEAAAAMFETEAASGEAQAAVGRVELLDGAARGDLRVVDRLLDLPDTGAGRARGFQNPLPLARAFRRQLLLDDGAQRRFVVLPLDPVGKARILKSVLAAERSHQRAILLLGVDGEQDVTVACLEEIGGGPSAHGLIA